MSWEAILAAGAIAVGVVGWILVEIIGEALVDGVTASFFRRSAFALRRGRALGWLRGAGFCGAAALLLVVVSVAAGTNGHPEDADDARAFAGAAALLVASAAVLVRVWWHRADPNRGYVERG